jgi:uncharacterized membrane protein YjjB (DUF3815 family)
MDHILFMLFAAALGIGGYSLMARASLRSLLPSLVVGVIGTGVYLISLECGLPEFASNLLGATFIYIGCAVSAKLFKAPTTIFLIPAQIILVPGKYLYHTFSHLLADEYMLAWESFLLTFEVSAGIACGLVCGLILYSLFLGAQRSIGRWVGKKS